MKTNKATSMTIEEIEAATAAVRAAHQGMEFLLPLTDAERSAMGRLGPRMVINTQMRLATAREHKDTLPPSFDLRKFERETALLVALDQCVQACRQLALEVSDTFRTIAKSAAASSKIAFGHLQVGAEASETLKSSVRLLKTRRSPRSAAPANAASATPATTPAASVSAPAAAVPSFPAGAPAPVAPTGPPPGTPADTPGKKAA